MIKVILLIIQLICLIKMIKCYNTGRYEDFKKGLGYCGIVILITLIIIIGS
jgi:hypothetical protein